MCLTFDDEANKSWPSRALQIWQILISRAFNKQLITYGELADILGFGGAGVLAHPLGYIMEYCQHHELPPLTSIVINQKTGSPGDGLITIEDYDSIDSARIEVFYYSWYRLVPPPIEELVEIHNKIQNKQKNK